LFISLRLADAEGKLKNQPRQSPHWSTECSTDQTRGSTTTVNSPPSARVDDAYNVMVDSFIAFFKTHLVLMARAWEPRKRSR